MCLPVKEMGVRGCCKGMQETVLQVEAGTLHHASSGREPFN